MTNFLQEGALLRHQGQWILLEGPFTEKTFHNSSDWSVYTTDFYDFNSEKHLIPHKSWILKTEELQGLLSEISHQLGAPAAQASLGSESWIEPEISDFSIALEQIMNRIKKGHITKAVPVVFSKQKKTVSAADRLQMLRSLTSAPENLWVYGFWKDGRGFLGATPESLFEYQDLKLQTMALAGTCPKEDSKTRRSLLDDPKELAEHQFVVEDLKKELSDLGEVKTQGPTIMELSTLCHLRTDFTIQCSKKPDLLKLIKKLHPTPALGVFPRSYGIEWMQAFPGQDSRKNYGAPVGFFSAEKAICLVGIRNIQWDHHSASIGSGCGIVADSTLEREWRELTVKRQSVRNLLGL